VACARALWADGFRVTAAVVRPFPLAMWSRRCSAITLPDPQRRPEAFVADLEQVLTRERNDVFVPGGEAALLALVGRRAAIESLTRVGLPPDAAIIASLDKRRQLAEAERAGLAIPPSAVCRGPSEAAAAATRFGYPVVLKPVRTQVAGEDGLHQARSAVIADHESLIAALPLFGDPVVIQQRMADARVVSCSGVLADGELRAVCCSRYARTWPSTAGAASFSETIAEPQGLVDRVVNLAQGLGHEGIFEVELLETPSGCLTFIDFNPRVYGSISVAIRAGANLPAVWCRSLLGQVGPTARARAGLHYRWEEGEVRNFLLRLHDRRFREAAAIARPRRRVVHSLFTKDDPAPFAALVVNVMSRGARRLRDRTLNNAARRLGM
jgi:predicted ATP-grasp superfamily ATP-dependent carboligase